MGYFLVIFSMGFPLALTSSRTGKPPLSTAKLEDSDSLDWREKVMQSVSLHGCLDVLLVLDGWDKRCF